MVLTIIDGSNVVLYAETAAGDGSLQSPYVWRHSDTDLQALIGSLGASAADTATLLSDPAAPASAIALLKALVVTPIKPWTLYRNTDTASAVIKSTSGNVRGVMCRNTTTTTRFLQLFNSATAPAAGGTPLLSLPVNANTTEKIGAELWGEGGLSFSAGIAFGYSSTEGSFTAATENAMHVFFR